MKLANKQQVQELSEYKARLEGEVERLTDRCALLERHPPPGDAGEEEEEESGQQSLTDAQVTKVNIRLPLNYILVTTYRKLQLLLSEYVTYRHGLHIYCIKVC